MTFDAGNEAFIGGPGHVGHRNGVAYGVAQDEDDVTGIVSRQFKGTANRKIRKILRMISPRQFYGIPAAPELFISPYKPGLFGSRPHFVDAVVDDTADDERAAVF